MKNFMQDQIESEVIYKDREDTSFTSVILLLAGLGIVMLFSASVHFSYAIFQDPFRMVSRQFILLAVSALTCLAAAWFPLKILYEKAFLIIIAAVLINILPLIPSLGVEKYGASRWINLGFFEFQPSELMKIAVIVYLARKLSQNSHRLHDRQNALLPPLLTVLISDYIIALQNDFSTAAFIFFLAFSLYLIAGTRIWYIIELSLFAMVAIVYLIMSKPYRIQRILAWFSPEADPQNSGYQILSSLRAIHSGGLWGKGPGQGIYKQGGLPLAHSDFIFSVLSEELGFIGVLAVVMIISFFAVKGYSIIFKTENKFYQFMAFGLTTAIAGQSFVNISVVCGLFPATGIPLPFFSAGGSSLLVTFIMCGLLLNISRNCRNTEAVQ